jgi:high-affinity nickel permease
VFGLDHAIEGLSHGGGTALVLAVAFVLGLRHASDPDHLVAVSTLVATDRERPARRASRLGLAWGLGHATTVVAFGVPIVLFDGYLPEVAQQIAEALVGVMIIALALRLLVRWRRSGVHVHEHSHDGKVHRHVHTHVRERHDHTHVVTRSPAEAFGVGLVHGVGGSAAVGVLLLASISSRPEAMLALLLFAAATAASMAALSLGLGYALGRGGLLLRVRAAVPALAGLSLAFGAWYLVLSLGPLV